MDQAAPEHNFASRIEGHATERPEALALTDARRRLSYEALADRVRRCASALAEAGVTRGDRVAVLGGNRTPYVETVLAAARLGAMAVPVNSRWSPRELAVLLDDCTPRAVVHSAGLGTILERGYERARHRPACSLPFGGDPARDAYELALEAAKAEAPLAAVSPEEPMILMYTSGTTGTPKGALLPHRKTVYNCRNAEIYFRMTAEDRVLVVVPLFHSFGLAILTLPTLYVGAAALLLPEFDATAVWKTVEAEKITFFGAVPTMFQRLLDEHERPESPARDLTSLRFLFSAGAAIPVELIRAYERQGLTVKQGFGQTETSILTCLDAGDAVRKAGSVGRPVRHAEVRVVLAASLDGPTETWRDAPVGETGEIVVRGPINMLGYWQRPEDSAATLRGEWLRTGDLARKDEEGFITLVGRARELYISGGENVYPAEVEAVLETHPSLREVAVVGEANERWGETGCAYVVPEAGARFDEEEVTVWARDQLAAFKIPKRWVVLDALPRTETGKVQKWRLGEVAR